MSSTMTVTGVLGLGVHQHVGPTTQVPSESSTHCVGHRSVVAGQESSAGVRPELFGCPGLISSVSSQRFVPVDLRMSRRTRHCGGRGEHCGTVSNGGHRGPQVTILTVSYSAPWQRYDIHTVTSVETNQASRDSAPTVARRGQIVPIPRVRFDLATAPAAVNSIRL